MEIHNDISKENMLKAHAELDKYFIVPAAEHQRNVVTNDGMTIKIVQDGLVDNIVNRIDRRRIILEKKADILNEYYGDSLRTKDLIKDYYSYKRIVSGSANLVSAGIILANLYTKVARNSVLFGGIGTLVSIAGVQAAGRYLTNNWLEKRVERNWKIHTNRMSQGLGPTNYPNNFHIDKETASLRFGRGVFNTEDLLGMSNQITAMKDFHQKVQPSRDHFNYLLDSENMNEFDTQEVYIQDRLNRQRHKDPSGLKKETVYDLLEPMTGIKTSDVITYHKSYELWKEAMNGYWTTWGANRVLKKSPFTIQDPSQIRNDRIVLSNHYYLDPLFAEVFPDSPDYGDLFKQPVNWLPDIADKFESDWKIRLLFNNYKKELAEKNFWLGENKVLDFDMSQFNDLIEKLETKERLKRVVVVDNTPVDKEKDYNNLGTKAEKYLRFYYTELVNRQRPVMLKETPQEFEYDFDFDVDEKNYDPWQEYKKVYRDVLTRGRKYWIIKSFPEWFFLQIGRPSYTTNTNISRYNPKRPNMEDSIFNFVMTERYFDEREQKMNLYNGYSQTIRI